MELLNERRFWLQPKSLSNKSVADFAIHRQFYFYIDETTHALDSERVHFRC